MTALSIEWGIAIIFFEIILGSFGRWLTTDIAPLSIRMALFVALMLGWMINWIRTHRTISDSVTNITAFIREFHWVGIGIVMAIYGALRGIALHTPIEHFIDDSNQWLIFAIIVPIASVHRTTLRVLFSRAWISGSTALALFSLFILYIFTHDETFGIGSAVYRWSRETMIGEFTTLSSSFLRVFLQSQLLLLPVWLSAITTQRYRYSIRALSILLASSIILSFSRSFAVALFSTVLLSLLIPMPVYRFERVRRIVGSVVLGGILIFAISKFPFPNAQGGSFSASFIERTTLNDAASASRWSLLHPLWNSVLHHPIVGSGLGATVTYVSSDPRVLEKHPSGEFTTHAFEWGVLDLWLKFGILGLLWYLSIMMFGFKLLYTQRWVAGLSVLVIAVTHVFTPFLNHPIGLMGLLAITLLSDETDLPTAFFDTWPRRSIIHVS